MIKSEHIRDAVSRPSFQMLSVAGFCLCHRCREWPKTRCSATTLAEDADLSRRSTCYYLPDFCSTLACSAGRTVSLVRSSASGTASHARRRRVAVLTSWREYYNWQPLVICTIAGSHSHRTYRILTAVPPYFLDLQDCGGCDGQEQHCPHAQGGGALNKHFYCECLWFW